MRCNGGRPPENRVPWSRQSWSCWQVSRLPWAHGPGCRLLRKLRHPLGMDKSPITLLLYRSPELVLLKKLPRAQRAIEKVMSCYQSPLSMPPTPIVRRRNIPAKVRYEKTRHVECEMAGRSIVRQPTLNRGAERLGS